MVDEKIFAHAVTLTAAFVANGDIRCGGSTNPKIQAIGQVEEMITTLYDTLRSAHSTLAGK